MNPEHAGRRILIAMLLMLPAVAPSLAASDLRTPAPVSLTLRPQASVDTATVSLADVLIFPPAAQQLCETIGEQTVLAPPGTAARCTVTYEQVERRLRELNVDMAQVLLKGATACDVTRSVDVLTEGPLVHGPAATGDEPSGKSAATPSDHSLAHLIHEQVSQDVASLGGATEIEFDQASRQLVELTTPPFEFSIQPQGRAKLGLREFRVTIVRDGQTQRTASVFGRVRLSKPVLVARKPLSVGASVDRTAVGPEPRVFDRDEDLGFDQVEQVIGQQVAKFVPVGQMVRRSDLKAVEFVQRSRPVTVVGAGPSVQVRLTGVALDTGSYGDTVRVRVGEGQKNRNVLRGVVTGMGTVRVAEGVQ